MRTISTTSSGQEFYQFKTHDYLQTSLLNVTSLEEQSKVIPRSLLNTPLRTTIVDSQNHNKRYNLHNHTYFFHPPPQEHQEQVKKSVPLKTSACRDEPLNKQPNKVGMTQYFTTSMHLVPFFQQHTTAYYTPH